MIADAGLQLAYLTGVAKLAERHRGGAGVILKFDHVRPPRAGAFQPLRWMDVTPEFLDRALRAMQRWGYEFVSIDDVCKRTQHPASSRRFVCLTFDGAYRDFATYAYPILSKHRVPFTLYVPTGFVDGIGEAWWLALEEVVARHSRIGLMIDESERHFAADSADGKYQVYVLIYDWLRTLPPAALSAAIGDLCRRYGVDLKKISQGVSLSWADLTRIARDDRATIASATVHYNAVARANDAEALREMTMGKSVLETALGIESRHFAFPFGDRQSFGARDVALARRAGYASAVSTRSGVVMANGKSDLHSLPRIAWDGRRKSLALLRAFLSGIGLPKQRDESRVPKPEDRSATSKR